MTGKREDKETKKSEFRGCSDSFVLKYSGLLACSLSLCRQSRASFALCLRDKRRSRKSRFAHLYTRKSAVLVLACFQKITQDLVTMTNVGCDIRALRVILSLSSPDIHTLWLNLVLANTQSEAAR